MNSLDYAIKMELDGEKYYREQAEKNKGNKLYPILLLLAEDEEKHANILIDKTRQLSFELPENKMLLEYKNVFKTKDDIDELSSLSEQLDLYKYALGKETESIDLYKELLEKALDNYDKQLYEYLIDEEVKHYNLLEEMITSVKNPKNPPQ